MKKTLIASLLFSSFSFAQCPDLNGQFKGHSEKGHAGLKIIFQSSKDNKFAATFHNYDSQNNHTGSVTYELKADGKEYDLEETPEYKKQITTTCHFENGIIDDKNKALTTVISKTYVDNTRPTEFSIRTYRLSAKKSELLLHTTRINSRGQVLDPLNGFITKLNKEK